MQWLNKVVDEILKTLPDGEILIESGGSPSGTYHLGHLRELITCEAVLQEVRNRGHRARHIYYVDDLDALRKIPVNIPDEYEKYLGRSLCDIPAPRGANQSYADYFLQDLKDVAKQLHLDVEFVHTHDKYRNGFFVPAIELALEHSGKVREILETVSGHKLGEDWSPIQVNEDGYLKKRRFVNVDKTGKTLVYEGKDGRQRSVAYDKGEVKLDWRIDWPARWWLLGINAEPFGRDHATKGGSYDTGKALMEEVFRAKAPLPVPYDFVNLAGDTKKMSASKGTGLSAKDVTGALPPEIVRYFMLRSAPSKRLYFDPENGVARLMDEFAETFAAESDSQLFRTCTQNLVLTVSRIPFSHLVASYQASLKDPAQTIESLARSEYKDVVAEQRGIIISELRYIDEWLGKWAPADMKFELLEKVDANNFSDEEKNLLANLAQKLAQAPANADGEWFHKAIYQLKEDLNLQPRQIFKPLYRVLIGKESGPRAGWFLSILPHDWLIKRLRFEA